MFRFTIRDVLWLTVVVACIDARADEPGPTLKELLRRSTADTGVVSPAQQVMHFHDKSERQGNARALAITWFYGRPQVALQYWLNEDGYIRDYRHVFNDAVQATHERTLESTELDSVKLRISKLPLSNAEPPTERTVLVSFQSGDKWRTETYDAAKLPDEFEKVMLIIGERFETKDRHKKQ